MESLNRLTRRRFITQLSGLGVGGAICLASGGQPALSGTAAAPSETPTSVPDTSLRLDTVTCAEFKRHLWTTFRFRGETGRPMDVTLVEAKELPARTQGGRTSQSANTRNPFALLFRPTGDPGLPQQTFRVEHDRLGTFEMFLVRLGPDRHGRRQYEAIFG